MTEYIVLIPDNETEWAAKDEAERQAMYGKHREFAEALAERGHKVTAGAELTPSAQARTVRREAGELRLEEHAHPGALHLRVVAVLCGV